MSFSRLGVVSCLLVAGLAMACSSSEEPTDDPGGTGGEQGTTVPVKPEDGQKSSTSGDSTAKQETPSTPNTGTTPPAGTPPQAGTPAIPGLPAGLPGIPTCAAPKCQGFGGFCGCTGGSNPLKPTIMGCTGGKCTCNGKSFADNGVCGGGGTPNAAALTTLFAGCGCT